MKSEIKERIEKINRGEVPEGYTKTKFGIIPDNWKVYKGEQLAKKITKGSSPNWQGFDYQEDGILFITSENVREGYLRVDEPKYLPFEFGEKQKNSKLEYGDLLINIVGASIGRSCEFNIPNVEANINQAVCLFRLKSLEDRLFIKYYLQSDIVIKRLLGTQTESARPNLSLSDIRNFEFILPDNPNEKKKIADILSTWDKAIELKEKLIEQKKEQKKGLMQRLLTGEVRLPGFKGEWKEVRLGEVLKERKETGHVHLELLAITALRGIVRRDEVDIKDNSSEDKSKYKRIMPLDIGYNTMRMWQGVSGVSKYEGIVSPAYTVLKPTDKVDSYFMGYLFKLPKVIDKFRRYSQGLVDDTLNLKYENFKVIKVRIPQDVNEQKAIAQILICVDKEIEFLEKELEALKQQKKGLMQLLLTGKIRVKC
ncbi:restriction endonuclease subunit S [Aneurinibacillus thermoaerophilus]|uniref:restriction endonuclease subunit S n=1 Tax=Aneurinibacillus thermoaerophilus TaxID=143495 RepID=UPI002E24E604|nr:restriction endonuclease subunit S [Aneurinibacillus thermoaerophilus]MED0676861.1 restriction endonuclease subunit S [Aneurinibacillus thermoaerophilus]